jgi:hypothetical protein
MAQKNIPSVRTFHQSRFVPSFFWQANSCDLATVVLITPLVAEAIRSLLTAVATVCVCGGGRCGIAPGTEKVRHHIRKILEPLGRSSLIRQSTTRQMHKLFVVSPYIHG